MQHRSLSSGKGWPPQKKKTLLAPTLRFELHARTGLAHTSHWTSESANQPDRQEEANATDKNASRMGKHLSEDSGRVTTIIVSEDHMVHVIVVCCCRIDKGRWNLAGSSYTAWPLASFRFWSGHLDSTECTGARAQATGLKDNKFEEMKHSSFIMTVAGVGCSLCCVLGKQTPIDSPRAQTELLDKWR